MLLIKWQFLGWLRCCSISSFNLAHFLYQRLVFSSRIQFHMHAHCLGVCLFECSLIIWFASRHFQVAMRNLLLIYRVSESQKVSVSGTISVQTLYMVVFPNHMIRLVCINHEFTRTNLGLRWTMIRISLLPRFPDKSLSSICALTFPLCMESVSESATGHARHHLVRQFCSKLFVCRWAACRARRLRSSSACFDTGLAPRHGCGNRSWARGEAWGCSRTGKCWAGGCRVAWLQGWHARKFLPAVRCVGKGVVHVHSPASVYSGSWSCIK